MDNILHRFLKDIHPSRNVLKLRGRADDALNAFIIESGALQGSEFEACLTEFHHRLNNTLLSLNSDRPLDRAMHWSAGFRLLEREYGTEGYRRAHEYASTGTEGGIRDVLRRIAYRKADEYAKAEIGAGVSLFLSHAGPAERIKYAESYAEAYSDLLPRHYLNSGGLYLKMYFHEVLEGHPFALLEARSRAALS